MTVVTMMSCWQMEQSCKERMRRSFELLQAGEMSSGQFIQEVEHAHRRSVMIVEEMHRRAMDLLYSDHAHTI